MSTKNELYSKIYYDEDYKQVLVTKANERIKQFREEFFNEFKVTPFIHFNISGSKLPYVDLNRLESVTNELLEHYYPNRYTSIKDKSRERDLLTIRQIMFKVAVDMGHRKSGIGQYFGFNHATIIHGCKKINDFLVMKEEMCLKIYNEIEYAYKERFISDGNVHNDSEPEVVSQSDLSTM